MGNELTHAFINSSHKYLVCHKQSTGDTVVNKLPMGLSGLMAGTNCIMNDFTATVLNGTKEMHRMPLKQTLEDLLRASESRVSLQGWLGIRRRLQSRVPRGGTAYN